MDNGLYATPPPAPAFDDCVFYHTMDLPSVGEVPGNFDLRHNLDEYLGPVQFAGRRVLEIGPASGFLTFEMERRGAEVVSIELSEDIPWDYVPYVHPQLEEWREGQFDYMRRMRNGYWYAHHALESKARVHYGSAYRLPEEIGSFDVSLMASVLLHNRDPLGIIANCARRTTERIVIVEQYDEELDKRGESLAKLVPNRTNDMVHTWWHLSPQLIRDYLEVLGFDIEHSESHVEQFAMQPGGDTTPLPHFTVIGSRRGR